MNEPLWDDEGIEEAVLLLENRFGTDAAQMAAKELRMLRNEYEARIAQLENHLKYTRARIAKLEGEPAETEMET